MFFRPVHGGYADLIKRFINLDRFSSTIVVAAFASICVTASGAEPAANFQKDIRPLLESHCIKCHGTEKQKGGVNFATLSDDVSVLRQRKMWRKAIIQVKLRQMPPEESKELLPEQRDGLLAWMMNVCDVNSGTVADAGPTLIRRLNRAQYNNTIRDLVGVPFDGGRDVGMPDEEGVTNFDNLAAALNMPPAMLDKYFAAADKVLDRLFDTGEASDPLAKPGAKMNKKLWDAICIAKPGKDLPERDAAKKVIARFASRAYRRPASDAEVTRLLGFYDKAIAKGGVFENGVRAMMKPVLVSPNFLFRLEQDRAPQSDEKSSRVSDHELASRLSYFIWSSMPDDALFALADQNKLSDPGVLQSEVKRMLADPKAHALTENFASQWLQIKKLAAARPSTEFFPTFKEPLRKAMYDETATFFDKLREDDRSIVELLDADYTYCNKELAKHYKLNGVESDKMQRVALKPEDHRGGLLGMASMLAMTSHTSRTSPTLRGRWILDVIFGAPPPPPPPDAGQIKEDKKNKEPKSFREQLAQHAQDANCAGCHRKMDPLGFALDSYDAVGAWRDDAGGKPIDTTGELPTGEKFKGPLELKQIVLKRKDEFVRNMTEKMLIFALGRELDYFDDGPVAQIQNSLDKNGYKFSVLIAGIVNSFEFQNRRNVSTVK
jgi:hypothetical protein